MYRKPKELQVLFSVSPFLHALYHLLLTLCPRPVTSTHFSAGELQLTCPFSLLN